MKIILRDKTCAYAMSLSTKILLIMKLSAILLTVISLHVSAIGFSQRITMSEKNASLEQVFERLQSQTGYLFLFNDQAMAKAKRVRIAVKDATLEEVLQLCFEEQPLSYTVVGKTIIVSGKQAVPDLANAPPADTSGLITVTGKVQDALSPLPGVSVILKSDPKKGVTTDTEGKYRIRVPANGTLLFSSIGYKPQEVDIRGEGTINIVMESSSSSLGEVAVVAYGVQKKASVVGAISTIETKELKTPVRSLNNVLAGKISGIIAVQRTGEPGYDDASFWIRGISTFGAGKDPLVLVDGIERPLNNIEPEEIASFSILKDASATAVYGVRGANGVVLVTTKRGSNQKPVVNFKYEKGLVSAVKLPKFLDGPTYLELFNEANLATNPNFQTPYPKEVIQKYRDGSDPYLYPNVTWLNYLMKDWSNNQRANLNISGGGEAAKYFVSASYYDEAGIWKKDELQQYNTNINLKRYNFRANVDINLNKYTAVDLNMAGILVTSNYPGNSSSRIFGWALATTPVVFPVKYPDGRIAGAIDRGYNPYDLLTQSGFTTEWRNTIQSSFGVRHDLSYWVKGLKVQGKFSFDAYNYHNIQRQKTADLWLATGRDANGELQLRQTRFGQQYLGFNKQSSGNRRIYMESSIVYDRTIGDHTLGGLLLYNQQDYVDANAGNSIDALPFRNQGFAGRGTYAYKNRYFLEFNFGYNGSENFEKKHRFGFFPSYAAGWLLSEEPFFKNNINAVELLKIRGSYGFVGNDQIGGRRFAYLTTVGNGNGGYTFGFNADNSYSGRGEDQWGADLSWERSRKTDLGLEIRFLKRFYIQADLFKELRSGIFLQRNSLPAIIGLNSTPWGNIGEMENKGFDGSLEYSEKIGAFNFSLRGNFTYASNKILENDEPDYKFSYQNRKGKRLGQQFGLVALGLFKDDAEINHSPQQKLGGVVRPGDIKYEDVNKDGVIDAYDEVAIGYSDIPEIVYGFGTSLNFKGVDLSLFFQGIGKASLMMSGGGTFPFNEGVSGNLYTQALDRWTPENPNPTAFYPRLSYGPNTNNYRNSTWWQKKGSFLRLKTIELGYTLPKALTSRIRLSTVRLYTSAFNVLTWSKFDLWDPELGGGQGAVYPPQKTFNFGVNVNF